jgi:hypothetical protein
MQLDTSIYLATIRHDERQRVSRSATRDGTRSHRRHRTGRLRRRAG